MVLSPHPLYESLSRILVMLKLHHYVSSLGKLSSSLVGLSGIIPSCLCWGNIPALEPTSLGRSSHYLANSVTILLYLHISATALLYPRIRSCSLKPPLFRVLPTRLVLTFKLLS